MICEYCIKKIVGIKRRYCNKFCRERDYYRTNKEKIRNYKKEREYNKCKCGNKKWHKSKRCRKCFHSNKYGGQLSKLK